MIKADGLAAGKGVTVALSLDEAKAALDDCFATEGASMVIEEMLVGEEASFFCLCDGTTALPFGSAQDHKRVGDGDTGPNTGGMGAYSPAPIMDGAMTERVMREIVTPTLAGMTELDMPFSGVLFAGLMITAEGPKLIEYNVRFGDPECQVLMMRLESDLLAYLFAAADGRLGALPPVAWRDEAALTVVMAAKGYPGTPVRGGVIGGLGGEPADVEIFQAGTRKRDGELVADGGRVLCVTATGASVGEAAERAYAAVERVDWADGFWRRDIGFRAIAREDAALAIGRQID